MWLLEHLTIARVAHGAFLVGRAGSGACSNAGLICRQVELFSLERLRVLYLQTEVSIPPPASSEASVQTGSDTRVGSVSSVQMSPVWSPRSPSWQSTGC